MIYSVPIFNKDETEEVAGYLSQNLSSFRMSRPDASIGELVPARAAQIDLNRAFGIHFTVSPEITTELVACSSTRLPLKEFNLFSPNSSLVDGLKRLGLSYSETVQLVWLVADKSQKASVTAINGRTLKELGGAYTEDMLFFDQQGGWAGTVNESGCFAAVRLRDKEDSLGESSFSEQSAFDNLDMSGITPQKIGASLFSNLSSLPLERLYNWFPKKLKAEKVVFFPDVTPVKGGTRIPSGCAVLTKDPDWRFYAVSDVGCGMQLIRSEICAKDFRNLGKEAWNALAQKLILNKGKLGDLGGGNHFVDAIASVGDDRVYFLIHTGSRGESREVERLTKNAQEFDRKYSEVVDWGRRNRDCIARQIEEVFGDCKLVCDRVHNFYEHQDNGSVLIRKGAVKSMPGSYSLVPSHMTGDISLVVAGHNISEALFSLCHGTGRSKSRMAAWSETTNEELKLVRNKIILPDCVGDNDIRAHAPGNYRDLDDCYNQIKIVCKEFDRFSVLAFMGRL